MKYNMVLDNSVLWLLIICIAAALVGLVNNILILYNLKVKREFAENFLSKFSELVKSRFTNVTIYDWIIKNSNKLQVNMGSLGYMAYKPFGMQYFINNYPIILNIIPEIYRDITIKNSIFGDNIFIYEEINEKTNIIRESIIRYIGSLEDDFINCLNHIKNPANLLVDGLSILINMPLELLYKLKLINYRFYEFRSNETITKSV